MKRSLHLGTFCTLLISGTAMAQIPNSGFEQWSDLGTYQEPTGWVSFNALTDMLGVEPACEQVTPGAVGNYAVKVTTRVVPDIGILPGLLMTGAADGDVDGFPYTARPQALNGKWKAAIAAGDEGMVVVTLTRWNPVLEERDDIGGGVVAVTGTVNAWTNFSAAIQYVSALDPDTAVIVILSSSGIPGDGINGSTLSVDDLSFGGSVGVEELSAQELRVFPSPTTDVLRITSDSPLKEVLVWSTDGQLVMQEQVNGMNAELDVRDLPVGLYILRTTGAAGGQLQRTFAKE